MPELCLWWAQTGEQLLIGVIIHLTLTQTCRHTHSCTTTDSRIHLKEATISLSSSLLPLSYAQGHVWLSLQKWVKSLMVIKCITRTSKKWGFSAPEVVFLWFHVQGRLRNLCSTVMPDGCCREETMHLSVRRNFYLLRAVRGQWTSFPLLPTGTHRHAHITYTALPNKHQHHSSWHLV